MNQPRRRGRTIAAVIALLIIALLLLLGRCAMQKKASPTPPPTAEKPGATPTPTAASNPSTPTTEAPEKLTPATLQAPPLVLAGAVFEVQWTGPDNQGDFITIVPKDAPPDKYGRYTLTREGPTLKVTAPMEPSASPAALTGYELRYIAARSRTILGRTPIEVSAAAATLDAPAEAIAGTKVSVQWTGPNNRGDYITFASKDWPDSKYGNYTLTQQGSPLTVDAPIEPGDIELRYATGDGHQILARRPIRIVAANVSLTAPDKAVAGSTIEVAWTGPNNTSDFVTLAAKGWPDDKYGNYTNTSAGGSKVGEPGKPLKLQMPLFDGPATSEGIGAGEGELRYVSGQGRKVLARRPIMLTPVTATLEAPAEAKAGEPVSITWKGPNYSGDYITIVAKGTPDGKFAAYANTSAGPALRVNAPKEPGEAEIRYIANQGAKVVARRAIKIVP